MSCELITATFDYKSVCKLLQNSLPEVGRIVNFGVQTRLVFFTSFYDLLLCNQTVGMKMCLQSLYSTNKRKSVSTKTINSALPRAQSASEVHGE